MLYRTTTPHSSSSSSSSLQALEMIHQHSSVDEFFVDNLLDLSNGFYEDEIEQFDEHPNGFNGEKPCSVSPQKKMEAEIEKLDDEKPCSVSTQKKMEAENEDLGYELSFRENGLDNLEWLSQFVEEDSCSGYSLMTGKLPENKNQSATEKKKIHVQGKSCFPGPVQTKPRTQRGRIGGRVWSLTGSSTSSASSSTTTTTAESVVRLNKRRKTMAEKPVQPRRCSHCGVQRTPQWRTGPMGTKTLCNACGVRFKSGRLLPEYRPACSPTFSSERHSNSHRKVLEMRQKKEAGTGGLAPPVHSF